MTKMIAVKNESTLPRYVGSTMIAPGETRHFPEHQVPAYLREVDEVEAPRFENPLATMLAKSIKDITGILPSISHDQLNEIETLEMEGAKRKGLMAAIQEERLRRADLELNTDIDTDDESDVNTEDTGSDSVITGDDLVDTPTDNSDSETNNVSE